MRSDPKTLIVRWFEEVWNQGKGKDEVIDELMASHATAIGLAETDRDLHGPAEFKLFVQNMRQALPDVRIEIEETVVQEGTIAARVVLKGTHLGDGLGVSPTGNRVSVRGMIMVQIEDGKIVEGWNSWDQLGLLRQIGALPVAGEQDRFVAQHA